MDWSILPDQEGQPEKPSKFDFSILPDQEEEKPSYGEIAKTGFKSGLAGAMRMYEIPSRRLLEATGLGAPGTFASEMLTPTPEEEALTHMRGIPGELVAGAAGLPGGIMKYGLLGAVPGGIPAGVAVFAAENAAEKLSSGKPISAKDLAEEGAIGGIFAAIGPLGKAAKAAILSGTFATQAFAETYAQTKDLKQALHAAVAPGVIGAGLGLMPSLGREAETTEEETLRLPYNRPLGLPPGGRFTMGEAPPAGRSDVIDMIEGRAGRYELPGREAPGLLPGPEAGTPQLPPGGRFTMPPTTILRRPGEETGGAPGKGYEVRFTPGGEPIYPPEHEIRPSETITPPTPPPTSTQPAKAPEGLKVPLSDKQMKAVTDNASHIGYVSIDLIKRWAGVGTKRADETMRAMKDQGLIEPSGDLLTPWKYVGPKPPAPPAGAEKIGKEFSIGDKVKVGDFKGVVSEINEDGSILVGSPDGKMMEAPLEAVETDVPDRLPAIQVDGETLVGSGTHESIPEESYAGAKDVKVGITEKGTFIETPNPPAESPPVAEATPKEKVSPEGLGIYFSKDGQQKWFTKMTENEEGKIEVTKTDGKTEVINKADIYREPKAPIEKPEAKTGEIPKEPLPRESIQSFADEATKGWTNIPDIHIIEKSEIPDRLLSELDENIADRIMGIYDPYFKKIYLIRDMLGTKSDVLDTIEHEAVRHYGVETVLGKDADPFFNRVYLKYGRSGLKDIANERGFDLDTQEGRLSAAREKFAQLKQTGQEPGLIKQFYAWIREQLAKIFPKLTITDAEIDRAIAKGRDFLINGEARKMEAINDEFKGTISRLSPEFSISPAQTGKAFFEEDLIPKAAQTKRGLKDSLKWFSDILTPTKGVSEEAMQGVRHFLGKAMETREALDHKEIIGDLTGKKISRMFDSMTEKEKEDFINLAMVGEKQATPLLDQIREFMGNMDQSLWERAKYWKPDLGWVDNHLRLLLRPGSSEAQVRLFRDTLSRKLPGTMGWSKQRFYDTFRAAKEAGLELAVKNPWEMWKLGALDQLQFIEFNEMKTDFLKNGFLKKFEPVGPGSSFEVPQGYVKTTENLNHIWFSGEGKGWYVEENLGRILNNHLSHDAIRAKTIGRTMMSIKNWTTFVELGINGFHATTETLTSVFSGLAESARKIYNVGILQGNQKAIEEGLKDLAKSPGSPITTSRLGGSFLKYFANAEEFKKTFRGTEFLKKVPNPDEWLQLLWDSGARFGMSEDYRLNTLRTMKENFAAKNYIGAALRSIPALNEILMKPLFEQYIPKLKVGTWLQETANMIAERSEDIISGKITKQQIGAERWKSVERRFGEMSFDNLFWNRTFKTASQMMVRSVTWQAGNIGEFGTGILGQSKELISAMREGRMPKLTPAGAWMMATFAGTAAFGAITQYALTGKNPESWKDYFYPQMDDQGNRISIPGYAKVGFSMVHDPKKYAMGAMAGWFGRFQDVINNKDFYGVQIHDPESNMIEKRVDDLIHLVPLPFSIQSAKRAAEMGEPFGKTLTGFLGATQAPYWIARTDAEQKASELKAAHLPIGGRTPADFERGQLIKNYAKRYQQAMLQNEPTNSIMTELHSDIAAGKLRMQDLLTFRQRIAKEPLIQSVMHLPFKDVLDVFKEGTAEEKKQLLPILNRKFYGIRSPEDRITYMPKMRQIMEEMRTQ